jgi:hypothetical protein
MFGTSPGNGSFRYNPDEPRDQQGRWTTGGSSWRANPVRRPSPAGRAHLLLGHALASAWHQDLIREFKLPTDAEAEQFARTLRIWNAASDLDPATFHDRFTHGLVDKPATVARLRQAAAGAAEAQTIGQMVDASRPLTQAIRDIGAHRWPWVREGLADMAAAAMPAQFAAPVGTTAATVGTGQTGMAAGDPLLARDPGPMDDEDQNSDQEKAMAALAGFMAGSPAELARLLGLAEATPPGAVVVAALGMLWIITYLFSNDDGASVTIDGVRYGLGLGTDGRSIVITSPNGKEIPIPQAPDGKVKDAAGQVIGEIRNGLLVITDPALRERGNACPPAKKDRGGSRSLMSLLYEAFIHLLVNRPPTDLGKGVPLPTPWADLMKNLRRWLTVMFDDCQRETGIMIEAKGLGYAKRLRDDTQGTLDKWAGQAGNQNSAARLEGRRVIWFFAEEAAANAARKLFKLKEYNNITVIYMPLPGAKR